MSSTADYCTLKRGTVVFLAKHPALQDFASLLSSGLGETFLDRSAVWGLCVVVGLHEFDRQRFAEQGLRVGIQTEQYFDVNGRKLWGCPSILFLLRQVLKYDFILDLSHANRKAYKLIPGFLRKKVIFGPYGFPDRPVDYLHHGSCKPPLFVGAESGRRNTILERISECGTKGIDAITGIYGDRLRERIRKSCGVINIHFSEGVYTELPRFLICYREGKLMYSERLAPPFIDGKHYVLLDEAAGESMNCEQAGTRVFQAINAELVAHYKFSAFLKEIMARSTFSY
jgi:hypothetical protein